MHCPLSPPLSSPPPPPLSLTQTLSLSLPPQKPAFVKDGAMVKDFVHELVTKAGEKPVDVAFEKADPGAALMHAGDVKELVERVKAGLVNSTKAEVADWKAELGKPVVVNVTELPKVRWSVV